MLGLENRILRLIASGASLDETARALCLEAEALSAGSACAIMCVDRSGALRVLAAPSLSEALAAALDGVTIGADFGPRRARGRSAAPPLVSDLANDPKWRKCGEAVAGAKLKSCWLWPIGGKRRDAVGALAFFLPEPRDPTGEEAALIMSCLDLCGIALNRHERVRDRERRASVDALTGMRNRAAFDAALATLSCDQPGAWALLVIDLDNLKMVNDIFGHQAGDNLICIAAARIAAIASPDKAFRLGGDEFAVIVRQPEALRDLDGFAARLFEALEAPAESDGHSIVPAATIGGAVIMPGDAGAETVYQNADFALYHAKETGRGGFVRYWPGIGTRMTHRRDAIRDVSAALAEGRIEAHYQPAVRLDTQEIVGVEALCRLRTSDGALLPAESFHEATSDARVADELTSRMLSIVAGDVRYWLDAGIPLRHVSVNVAPADFYTGDLLQKLEQSFGRVGAPLDCLIVEVSEDVSAGARDKVVGREIERLRSKGLRVALDDFGTGHASLTHLLSVPVDAIKIDRSFIARLWPEDPSMAIVQGLIDIARQLNIQVLAEGIETEVQASQLWTMGCLIGQGFAFSRAVDRDAMTGLLRKHAHGLPGIVPLRCAGDSAKTRDGMPIPSTGDGLISGVEAEVIAQRLHA